MEAINFTAKTQKLELNIVPIPKVTKPNQVLVKVAYSGICGTDLHVIQGEFPCNPDKTFTLGHEFSGTVVEVGPEVNIFKKGDRVSVDPNDGCKSCNFCHSGNPHYCLIGGINNTIGIYRNGGWAEYVLAPLVQVHKIPDSITLEQGKCKIVKRFNKPKITWLFKFKYRYRHLGHILELSIHSPLA
ncbi:hypothetical protein NQ314_007034 [Rhamnusium bicolor]|uniref:Alcohol dehydrogenase-like N-terminal domain-containing protein n=1 Tax=Rhamnusium bicolor TaxID=1586634 RepID=A0AAV8YUI7_9CUCU|nr:hypothetical protein NQ314_007034 [Rhamnusium bicolor]